MKRLCIAVLALALVFPLLAQEKPPKEEPGKQAAQAKPAEPPAKPQEGTELT